MSAKIFVVTGANKGIGYGIVRSLAEKVRGGTIYLTSRNVALGEAALRRVVEELGDKKRSKIVYHQLDITDEVGCRAFAHYLREKHGEIDVLINNAGVTDERNTTDSDEARAEVTIGINYYGTKRISKHLEPIIRNGGRIVNISSQDGVMRTGIFASVPYGEAWIDYMTRPDLTEEDIDQFVEDYKKAVRNRNLKECGFPRPAYRISKTAEIAYTVVLSKALASRNIIVNACCPGYVDTDMSDHVGPLTVEEGADTPVYLALNPNVPNGKFAYKRKAITWH